ncbi:hypothetical protein B0I35DRAFT_126593 [Stachybotrys elegans]|uniref:RAD52 homolog n=1 Tax=Stachybotrys elegans TaxID=80388 RepID=A0A8K0SZI4_9HYPO|nr:hypothetical protein B0I35DRAFT_126593 [Stachybotrys elegans]
MPASGEQHTAWANPFEESKPGAFEWTPDQLAVISSKLDKKLGPEYISSRAGPGGSRVHYLTAEKCIALANEVFGFNGWSSSIQNIQVDFADENPQTQRVSIGLSVIVRVTLRNGTYHEDIGYGSIDNAKGKAMAFEKAKKEGTTDGLKRALRSFGNVLGNCIYDQDYVKQVTKLKVQPTKFNPDNLHRHSDFIVKKEPVKPQPAAPVPAPAPAPAAPALPDLKPDPEDSFEDFFGELDSADFCVPGEGHPDEIIVPNHASVPPQVVPPPTRSFSGGNESRPPQTPKHGQSHPGPQNATRVANQSRPAQMPQGRQGPTAPAGAAVPQQQAQQAPQSTTSNEPVAFFSARAVNQLPETSLQASQGGFVAPRTNQLFNPKAESPSIRKTPGIDHNSSKPVSKGGQHVPPAASQTSSTTAVTPGHNGNSFTPVRPSMNHNQGLRANVVNPSLDYTRRIGAPGGPSSPLANRSSYKPPTMKRPLANDPSAQQRQPLADLPTNEMGAGAVDAGLAGGVDAKRQKMT